MNLRIILCTVLVVVPALVFAAGEDFTRALRVGMRGEDVRALQVVLNSDPETRIISVGAGSPGNETDYFGPATKRALIKFQEKYREDVLTPAGLSIGTGFFGEKTRLKAKTLLLGTSLSKSIAANNTTAAVATPALPKTEARSTPESLLKGEVFIAFPSRYSGKPGTEITISGFGFTATGNNVYLGVNSIAENVSSVSGETLSIKIPNIPKGLYPLSVKNTRGETKGDSFFVVTDGVTPEPKVESVTPDTAERGSVITVKGSGFTATGNMIRTTVSISENIPSVDGKSLSFTLPSNILMATTSASLSIPANAVMREATTPGKKVFLPVWVVVVNENGVSNGKSFNLGL